MVTIPNNIVNITMQSGQALSKVVSASKSPIVSKTAKASSSIFTSIQDFFKGSSTGNKLVKTAIGIGAVGGSIAVGTSLATPAVVDSGNKLSKGFGIPMELLFIIGAVLLVLILVGGRKR
ncbi:MAG TPA: hypothetical protein VLE02_02725 [Nitrosarchaeum sp.]|nr:hypothetical protein [Nitrosarchaeum sp.]